MSSTAVLQKPIFMATHTEWCFHKVKQPSLRLVGLLEGGAMLGIADSVANATLFFSYFISYYTFVGR